MSEFAVLDRALCLSASEIEALVDGRLVVAVPQLFVTPGWQFGLYPVETDVPKQVSLAAWARCELCQVLERSEDLGWLSRLTVWSADEIGQKLAERQHLFLAYLRVYLLPQAVEVSAEQYSSEKLGKFIALPKAVAGPQSLPVLTDAVFARRRYELEQRVPSRHAELAVLQGRLAEQATVDGAARRLERDVRVLLGWSTLGCLALPLPDWAWIDDIVPLGERSKEQDRGKSNYQAGTDFENIVRRSLEFLGFTVDEAYKGGAGGLDLFCSKPYPLVGECKAGKKIPRRTTEELIKLGGMHLTQAQFQASAKLVIGPGKPTRDVLKAAKQWNVSIINPMTLQKLVELQASYPGAVNLVELKPYLAWGQIDDRIEDYIKTVKDELRLRSHIVHLVKTHLESAIALNAGTESIDLNTLFGLYCASGPPRNLQPQDLRDLAIELSSPLAGYLGRQKDDRGNDRFYFLRDLPAPSG